MFHEGSLHSVCCFGLIALGVFRFACFRFVSGITGALAHDGLDASCQGSAAENR
jgi:hypothetical protein